MDIYKAIVEPYRPYDAENIINAVILPDKLPIKVKYTSPNHQRYFYGFFALPALGSEILIAYDKERQEYYYLSTIVDYAPDLGKISKNSNSDPADLYSAYKNFDTNGNPTAMFLKNQKGAGLQIQNYFADGEITNEVRLKSSSNSELILSDTPGSKCVTLKNSDGDNITIGGEIDTPFRLGPPHIARGIVFNSLNTQQFLVGTGAYEVRVTDGTDVTLTNLSRGNNKAYVPPNLTPPEGTNPNLQFGNINLITKFRDINIFTDNPAASAIDSNIYISTQNGMVQINSGGDVKIFSQGKVTIQATEGLDLQTLTGDINIEAKTGNVNIKSTGDTNLNSTAFNVLAATTNITQNVGAPATPAPVFFVGGTPVTPLPVETPKLNVYGK